MTRFTLKWFVVAAVFVVQSIFISCDCKKEKTVDKPSQEISNTTNTQKTPPVALPDYAVLKEKISVNLDRQPSGNVPKSELESAFAKAKARLDECRNENRCEKREMSKLHLMLGDIYFTNKNFPSAREHYEKSILSRSDAFVNAKNDHKNNLDINNKEIKTRGETPFLLAAKYFLEAKFSLDSFKDFAEMARVERRLANTLSELGDLENAKSALARAQIGLDKSIGFRKSFDSNKNLLLEQKKALGPSFDSYEKHVDLWMKSLNIPKI